jgi:cold shock CspA family protein
LRGRIAVRPDSAGYGFVQPEGGGGQVLFRSSSIASGVRLRVDEAVEYALTSGTFAVEADELTPVHDGGEDER